MRTRVRPRTILSWTVLLLCAACSDPAPSAPTVEPEPSSIEEPAPDEPEATPPRDEGGTPSMVRVVDLPDEGVIQLPTIPHREVPHLGEGESADDYAEEELPTRPALEHPAGEGRAWLDAAIAAQVESVAEDRSEGGWGAWGESCITGLAHERLFSMACMFWESFARDDMHRDVESRSYVIGSSELSPLDVRAQIRPGFDLDQRIRTACERDPAGFDREGCGDAPYRAQLALQPDGLLASVCDRCSLPTDFRVPWRALDRAVRADSPLGEALLALEGARTVEVAVPPEASETQRGLRVSEPMRTSSLLQRWHRLDEPTRGALRVVPVSDPTSGGRAAVLAMPDDGDRDDATTIARALGVTPEPLRWNRAATPIALRTRVNATLRNAPYESREVPGYLPAGTLVTALRGRVDGRDSSFGQRNTWAASWVTPSTSGFVAGNLLEERDGCAPSADSFVSAMPEDRHERARRTLMRVVTELRQGGRRRPVTIFAALTAPRNRRNLGASRIEVHARGDDCSVGRRLARWDIEGAYFAILPTSTAQRGGEPLFIIGTRATTYQGPIRWRAFRLGSDEPVFDLRRVQERAPEVDVGRGDTWAPLRLGQESFVWSGEALTPRE